MNGFGRHRRTWRGTAGVVAALCLAILTAACGGSSSPATGRSSGKSASNGKSPSGSKSASTGSGRSATASVKLAAFKSTAASGYRVAMTMSETVSGSNSGETVVDMTANGSFSAASHTGDMTMNMQVSTGGGSQDLAVQSVLDGDTMYLKLPAKYASQLPGDKPWVSLNFSELGKTVGTSGLGSLFNSGSNFNDPGQYLDFLRATSDGSVKDLGKDTVDGRQVTHYQADLDLAKLPDAVPAADRAAVTQLVSTLQKKGVNTQMPIDAWIDSSNLIRRLEMSYDATVQGQSVSVDITAKYGGYGSQPTPKIPSPDQTTDATSVLQRG